MWRKLWRKNGDCIAVYGKQIGTRIVYWHSKYGSHVTRLWLSILNIHLGLRCAWYSYRVYEGERKKKERKEASAPFHATLSGEMEEMGNT